MREKQIKARQGMVFERIVLQIFNLPSDGKKAKAAESPDPECFRERETRMSGNTMPCFEEIG